MEFRDLKRQYQVLRPALDAAMQRVAEGSHYIMGPEVKALETELAEYVGVRHCLTCANGTDALTLALKAWGVGVGDAVFVPDFTFFSSAEVVSLEGATPVFVDVKADTFNIDADDLERAIEATLAEGTLTPRVVVAVDLFGLPADYAAVRRVADKYGLLILEDGAQGFGGAIGDRRACSFGDIATTSFFPAKPLGCYGDGGAVFTDNDEWAALIDSYRVHGKGTFKYDNVRIGLNSRLDTLQAAILQVKFQAFRDYELEAVNKAAEGYTARLSALETKGLLNLPHPNGAPSCAATPLAFRRGDGGEATSLPTGEGRGGAFSSWAQYTIRLQSKSQRDALQAYLKEQGIPSMVYYPTPMHLQTAFRILLNTPLASGRGVGGEACPVATHLCDVVLSLPMHPYMDAATLDTICRAIESFLSDC